MAKKITPKKTISKKNQFGNNPRIITDKEKDLLKEHIEELGDLSGVVYCQIKKAYVGGNQRSDVFDGAKIEIIEKYDKPTKHHTVAHGFINYKGEKFAYREVQFTTELFDKACIVANSDGGSFDWVKLSTWNGEKLTEWGVPIWEQTGVVMEDEMGEDFDLPNGEKSPFQQMTFVLSDNQVEQIKEILSTVQQSTDFKDMDSMENDNRNGNALYLMAIQWVEQKK